MQPDRKSALRTARVFTAEYGARFPEAIGVLAEGSEDSLQFYAFPEFDQRKIASTNVLGACFARSAAGVESWGVFPSAESCVRLTSCYLLEYSEDWLTERSYVRKEATEAAKARMVEAA